MVMGQCHGYKQSMIMVMGKGYSYNHGYGHGYKKGHQTGLDFLYQPATALQCHVPGESNLACLFSVVHRTDLSRLGFRSVARADSPVIFPRHPLVHRFSFF